MRAFAAVAAPAVPQPTASETAIGPDTPAPAQTVTGARKQVFATNQGPEAAAGGIQVVGEFLDRGLAVAGAQSVPWTNVSTESDGTAAGRALPASDPISRPGVTGDTAEPASCSKP